MKHAEAIYAGGEKEYEEISLYAHICKYILIRISRFLPISGAKVSAPSTPPWKSGASAQRKRMKEKGFSPGGRSRRYYRRG
jgi:hypothetical protein